MFETHFAMQCHRSRLSASDYRNHLAKSEYGRLFDQRGQQLRTNALPYLVRPDVDRIFARKAVGRPIPKLGCIGIANNVARPCRDQKRPPFFRYIPYFLFGFRHRARHCIEACATPFDMRSVNCGN